LYGEQQSETISSNPVLDLLTRPLTPSRLGPQHGLELISRVSSDELYFNASAKAANPDGSIRLSLKLSTLSVLFRFKTCAMYPTPFCRFIS
jgi:hypothetical protein